MGKCWRQFSIILKVNIEGKTRQEKKNISSINKVILKMTVTNGKITDLRGHLSTEDKNNKTKT